MLLQVALVFLFSQSVSALSRKPVLHEDSNSNKQTSVVFVKTHETGSSTLTSILHRFCDANNVTCFVHPAGRLAAWKTLHAEALMMIRDSIKNDPSKQFQIFPSHTLFEPEIFKEMVPGALRVSLFREPHSRTVSSYCKGKETEEVSKIVADMKADVDVYEHEKCGMESHLMSEQVQLDQMKELDFVLLTEKYDLGLVLMRRALNWNTRDIVYVSMKVQSRDDEDQRVREELGALLKSDKRTAATEKVFQKCIQPELEVYEEATKRFDKQLSSLSHEERKSVEEEFLAFQQTLNATQSCCDAHPKDKYCQSLRTDNLAWTHQHQQHRVHELGINSGCYNVVKEWEKL